MYEMMEEHPGNNSPLHPWLGKHGSVRDIVDYMTWISQQPAYETYLRRWLPKIPDYLYKDFYKHIEIEEAQKHGSLFRDVMMVHLRDVSKMEESDTVIDHRITEQLNYTFSEQCANEKPLGFGLGVFLTCEATAVKKFEQIFAGLRRHGVDAEPLRYLTIHIAEDSIHGRDVAETLISPLLDRHPEMFKDVEAGVLDRMERCDQFFKWYSKRLGI